MGGLFGSSHRSVRGGCTRRLLPRLRALITGLALLLILACLRLTASPFEHLAHPRQEASKAGALADGDAVWLSDAPASDAGNGGDDTGSGAASNARFQTSARTSASASAADTQSHRTTAASTASIQASIIRSVADVVGNVSANVSASPDNKANTTASANDIDVIMGPQQHGFLQAAFPDVSKASFVSNVSSWWEPQSAAEAAELLGRESQYAPWIQADLAPWRETGITKGVVDAAAGLFDVCDGDMLRFQIINGSLWVNHVTDRLPTGWYPAQRGPGKLAARAHVPFAVLALLDMLRLFPGQVPDVDAVIHTADFTCVPRTWPADINASLANSPAATAAVAAGLKLPVLGYQGSASHLDLPWPDFSFYGSEWGYLEDPWGRPAQSWAVQSELLYRQYADVSLVDRLPQAVWRGRIQDPLYPQRDHTRRTILKCERDLRQAGRVEEASLLNVQQLPVVGLQDVCDHRFNLYLESQSYASNLKQKMVCGSVLVAPQPQHWEFFGRSLQPGEHFVEVTHNPEHVCQELVGVLRDMNDMVDSRGRRELGSSGKLPPNLAMQADGVAARQAAAAGVKEPAAGAGGRYSWGSGRMPWEIAAAEQRFIREQVRNQDALLYMRDLLRAYAALQRFKPVPFKARCYTGDLLLQEFGFPHKVDEALVERAYPWLRGHDGGCKEATAAQGGKQDGAQS